MTMSPIGEERDFLLRAIGRHKFRCDHEVAAGYLQKDLCFGAERAGGRCAGSSHGLVKLKCHGADFPFEVVSGIGLLICQSHRNVTMLTPYCQHG